MRLRFSAIPATLLLAGTALAQDHNALSLWRSDVFSFIAVGIGAAPGQTGQAVWTCFPADVLTYFGPNAGARKLHLSGFETVVATFGAQPLITVDRMQVMDAFEAPAPNQGRLKPGVVINPGGNTVWADTGATSTVPNPGPGAVVHVSFNTPVTAVPAGDAAGNGLCFYVKDYQTTFGGAAGSTWMIWTNGIETSTQSFGGVTFPPTIAAGGTYWDNQLILNPGAVPFTGHALQATLYFTESMVGPGVNANLNSALVGGGVAPTYNVYMNDGRGAVTPLIGDVITYKGNSRKHLGFAGSTVFFVPMVMFDGFIGTGILDPTPENWVANGGGPQNGWIHPMSTKAWLNQTVALGTGDTTGTIGTLLCGANDPTQAVYLGLDDPGCVSTGFYSGGIFNPNIWLFGTPNAFFFADLNTLHGGAETQAVDSVMATNPNGILGRNAVNFGIGIGEQCSLLNPQWGYTDFANGGAGFLGFGQNPGLAGQAFYVSCWMLGVGIPGGVTALQYQILDWTNVIKYSFN